MGNSQKQRRGKGRPSGANDGVGRDALIAATLRLLKDLKPAQVTIAAIAREAGVDPALVRYYFGSRENLLFEVAQRISEAGPTEDLSDSLASDARIETMIHRTFRFTRSAKYMQRLIAEELSGARSPEIRKKLREWQHIPVESYRTLLKVDSERQLTDFDPLFLHLAVVGISDFFHSGEEVVKMLVPEGTDLAALERDYEAFITKLLLEGLRRR